MTRPLLLLTLLTALGACGSSESPEAAAGNAGNAGSTGSAGSAGTTDQPGSGGTVGCSLEPVPETDNAPAGSTPRYQLTDPLCQGTHECLYLHPSYDEQGRVQAVRLDENCDCSTEFCRTFTYDDGDGRLIAEHDSLDCMAAFVCTSYEYDAEGRLTKRLRNDGCNLLDGLDDCFLYFYDGSDNTVRMETYEGVACDGTAQPTRRTDLHYDANGYLTKAVEGADCTVYTNDANGNVLDQFLDEGCDGTPDRDCIKYFYGKTLTETP